MKEGEYLNRGKKGKKGLGEVEFEGSTTAGLCGNDVGEQINGACVDAEADDSVSRKVRKWSGQTLCNWKRQNHKIS
jgi:hypothetical protein